MFPYPFNFQPSNFLYKFKICTNLTWPGWSTIIIWTIGLIFLFVSALLNVLPIFNDYENNNVATQILVIKNETIRPPNMTVCLPYYSGSLSTIATWILYDRKYRNETIDQCLECESMANRSWDIWNEMNFDQFKTPEKKNATSTLAFSNAIASGLVKKFLHERHDFDLLLINESNFNWNQPLVDAVWIFLSCVTVRDLLLTGSGNVSGLPYSCVGFNFTEIGHVENNILDRFFDLVLKAVEIYLKTTVEILSSETYEFSSLGQVDFKNRTVVIMKGSYFCFPIFDQTDRERFQYTPFNDEILPPWRRFVRKAAFSIFYDPSVLYGAVDESDGLYDTETATGQIVDKATMNFESVTVTYTVDTRVLEARPNNKNTCSKENNPAVCLAKRLAETAIEYCKCRPFTFRNLIPSSTTNRNLAYCNDFLYNGCKNKFRKILHKFTSECANKCEYIFYRWKQTFSFSNDDSLSLNFDLRIDNIDEPFIEFSLIIRDTWQKFLSQIGGLINLYLGVSGLTLCGLIVFCVDSIKRCFQLRKKDQEIHRTTISKIKLSRMDDVSQKKSPEEANEEMNLKMERMMEKMMKKWRNEDREKLEKISKRLEDIYDHNLKIDKILKEKNILA